MKRSLILILLLVCLSACGNDVYYVDKKYEERMKLRQTIFKIESGILNPKDLSSTIRYKRLNWGEDKEHGLWQEGRCSYNYIIRLVWVGPDRDFNTPDDVETEKIGIDEKRLRKDLDCVIQILKDKGALGDAEKMCELKEYLRYYCSTR